MRRRPFIAQKRAIYVGCEGASEIGYVRLLQDFADEARLTIHLVNDELSPGAGDPLARIRLAVKRLAQLRKTRGAPAERFVLMDHDQAERNPEGAAQAIRLATENDIKIIWQKSCFEAVLLRHLDGRATHRPPDTPTALQTLIRNWPEYAKPMNRNQLAAKIDIAAVLRAASVEEELRSLLVCIGLINE